MTIRNVNERKMMIKNIFICKIKVKTNRKKATIQTRQCSDTQTDSDAGVWAVRDQTLQKQIKHISVLFLCLVSQLNLSCSATSLPHTSPCLQSQSRNTFWLVANTLWSSRVKWKFLISEGKSQNTYLIGDFKPFQQGDKLLLDVGLL